MSKDPNECNIPCFPKIKDLDLDSINFDIVEKCKHPNKEVLKQRLCLLLDDGINMGLFIAIICLNCGKTDLISQEIIKDHLKGG